MKSMVSHMIESPVVKLEKIIASGNLNKLKSLLTKKQELLSTQFVSPINNALISSHIKPGWMEYSSLSYISFSFEYC